MNILGRAVNRPVRAAYAPRRAERRIELNDARRSRARIVLRALTF